MNASLHSTQRGLCVPDGVGVETVPPSIATVDQHRLDAFIDPNHLASSIAEQLKTAASASASEWWWTGWWELIQSHYGHDPLVTVMASFADCLRGGENPGWVVGSDSPTAAVRVAEEWLAHGIPPLEVRGWLAARCRYPRVARAFTDAGLRPPNLLNSHGQPQPVAAAVANGELSVDQAVAWVQQNGEAYRVLVDRRQGIWRVDIEGVAVIHVARLADVADRAHDVIRRLHRSEQSGGVWLNLDVRLPAPVQRRLELAEHYRAEADQTASDSSQQTWHRSAEAALCGAARELVAMGVIVDDIAQLLDVSHQRVHELVDGDRPASPGEGS